MATSDLMAMSSPSAVFINDLYCEILNTLQLAPIGQTESDAFYTFHLPETDRVSGHLRILDGGNHPDLLKVVQLSLDFGSVGADAHALHLITKPDSLVPHCSVEFVHYDAQIDSIRNPAYQSGIDHYGAYINLLSRVDAGVNQRYLHYIYDSLHDGVMAIKNHEAIHQASMPLWQAACFSPWVITASTTAADFPLLKDQARRTFEQALWLLDEGIPSDLVSEFERQQLAERDKLHRSVIYSVETDPVWLRIMKIIGEADASRLREVLASQSVDKVF